METKTRVYYENLIADYCKKMTTHLNTKEDKSKWLSETFGLSWSEINTASIEDLDLILVQVRKKHNDFEEKGQNVPMKFRTVKECSFNPNDPLLYKY